LVCCTFLPPHKRLEWYICILGLEPLQPSLPGKSCTQKQKPSTSSRTSGFWSLSKTIAQKPEDDPTTMKANLARLPQTSVRYVHKIICRFGWFVYGVQCHFQQYLRYIVAVSLIDGGNWSPQRKPRTCGKSLTNFIT
jgi:hypothetical protein